MRHVIAVSAALLVGAVAGCASEEPGPGDVVKTYLTAFTAGDGKKACDQLTGEAKREAFAYAVENLPEIQAKSCEEALSTLSKSLGGDEKSGLEDAKLAGVKETGDTAEVTIEGGTSTAELTRSGGRWFVSGGLFESTASADTPSPDEPTAEVPEETPASSEAAPVRAALEVAGFTVSDGEVGGTAIAALRVELAEIVFYSSDADAQKDGDAIGEVYAQAPGRGLVRVEGNRVYRIGREQKLTAAEKAEFSKIVTTAESAVE